MGTWLGSEHSLVESTSMKDYSTPVVIRFKYKRGFKKIKNTLHTPFLCIWTSTRTEKYTCCLSPWRIPVKETIFDKVAGFRPATQLKTNFFAIIFQRF